jgi:hypothetical protein
VSAAVDTDLTVAQRARLESLADQEPDARVVGWQGAPVVRRSDGRLQRLVATGRLNAVERRAPEPSR